NSKLLGVMKAQTMSSPSSEGVGIRVARYVTWRRQFLLLASEPQFTDARKYEGQPNQNAAGLGEENEPSFKRSPFCDRFAESQQIQINAHGSGGLLPL